MKFRNPFRKMFDRSPELAAFEKEYAEVSKLEDAGERLMGFTNLHRQSYGMARQIDEKVMNRTATPAMLGILATFGGVIAANPVLIGAGVVAIVGGIAGHNLIGDETIGSLYLFASKCEDNVKETIQALDMKTLARSPQFDNIVATYPDLKEKFILAASRDKLTAENENEQKPEAPKKPKSPGGFQI